VTLGPAAACWVVAVWQMNGMDMGVATRVGPFGVFLALWAAMMAAMMLPGAAPAVIRRVQAGGVHAVPVFIGSYLAVWATAGMAVYTVDRPHGSVAAGVTLIVAGAYEITPLKRQFRRRCRASTGSGFGYGLCCAGSSIGLMAMLVALGVMCIPWMAVITVVVLAQKLLPARAAIDVPLALAIIGLGMLIILTPSSVPGLTPPVREVTISASRQSPIRADHPVRRQKRTMKRATMPRRTADLEREALASSRIAAGPAAATGRVRSRGIDAGGDGGLTRRPVPRETGN
jgi:hypothetical protein